METLEVHLSFQCLFKIMQHSRDFAPDFVSGQLLGMDTDSSLEITDCFPFATNLSDDVEQEEYQIETMKALRESNVDTNTVGWYQSCSFDAFLSSSLTEAQAVYQSTIPSSVVLIFDPSKSILARPVVRAFQVRSNYREILMQECSSNTDKFNLIFKELPVKISMSILDRIFLNQESSFNKILPFSALSSPSEVSEFSANLFASLIECTDDSIADVGKLQYSLRNIVKNSQSSRNKKKEESTMTEYLNQFKHNNSGSLVTFCHTLCQIEQFEKLLAEFCEISNDKLCYN